MKSLYIKKLENEIIDYETKCNSRNELMIRLPTQKIHCKITDDATKNQIFKVHSEKVYCPDVKSFCFHEEILQ